MRCALFGFGYWGTRVARAIESDPDLTLTDVIDPDPHALLNASHLYSLAKCSPESYSDLSKTIDLAFVATRPSQHFEVVKWALNCGVPVVVSKPLTLSSSQDSYLRLLAEATCTPLFVDYTYLYSSGIQEIKRALIQGSIGAPRHLISLRTNLGIVQKDCNVLWDLIVHDLAIIDYLFRPKKISFSVIGVRDPESQEVSTTSVSFIASGEHQLLGTLHASWYSALKSRLIAINGTNGTITFDDVKLNEKLQIVNGSVVAQSMSSGDQIERIISYQLGSTKTVELDPTETLRRELRQIREELNGNKSSFLNPAGETASIANRVSLMIEACQRSLLSAGNTELVELD